MLMQQLAQNVQAGASIKFFAISFLLEIMKQGVLRLLTNIIWIMLRKLKKSSKAY